MIWQPCYPQSGCKPKCSIERTDECASPELADHGLAFTKFRDYPTRVCLPPIRNERHNFGKFLVVETIKEKMGCDQVVACRVRLEFLHVFGKETDTFPEAILLTLLSANSVIFGLESTKSTCTLRFRDSSRARKRPSPPPHSSARCDCFVSSRNAKRRCSR